MKGINMIIAFGIGILLTILLSEFLKTFLFYRKIRKFEKSISEMEIDLLKHLYKNIHNTIEVLNMGIRNIKFINYHYINEFALYNRMRIILEDKINKCLEKYDVGEISIIKSGEGKWND